MASVVNITNISVQTIPIVYSSIAASKSTTDVNYAKAGQMLVQAGSTIEIEAERVELGQLDRLRALKLITYTTR